MKDLKALEILKKLQIDVKKDIEVEGIEVFGYIDTSINEAIAELEIQQRYIQELESDAVSLQNEYSDKCKELEALKDRSCDGCEYNYVDIDDNCQRCKRYDHDDYYKAKE